ncbi:MAG: hypothetical protein A2086_08290 [Spirochaetes bacterium GWD1_27_9]|nr:MAG: hypothetical protein A2Z98_12795 [Spirochaetes bacterium GWB1_27_13]OHD23598.1 MAG: hypothetical protein A2Y34_08645 [Spirochaetes bacterium GWC1_27_15]OHD39514.1 MAG: hypothetical protein A2086_08290 [Spirochaetes bacterium GWD1_27_9]
MKKNILITAFFLILQLTFSLNLVQEIYSDSTGSQVVGKKDYLYDERNNIISIISFNQDLMEESKLVYTYEEDKLILAEEFQGNSKIKYSKFEYDAQKKVAKKIEYDTENRIILTHNYIYDASNNLVSIEDYYGSNLAGKKNFVYKNGKLVEEYQLDQNNNKTISKIYNYSGNNISKIDFYLKERKIRIIERIYGKLDTKTNIFGFSYNYWDIR